MPVLAVLSEETLQPIDIGLMTAGGIILLAAAAVWWRRGHRDPLRGSPIRLNRLTPLWLWLCILGQLLCWTIGGLLVPREAGPENDAASSPQSSVLAANLAQALVVVMCLIVAHLTFAGGRRGFGLGRRPIGGDIIWGGAGWLVSLLICSLLYWGTMAIWTLLRPDSAPPEHAVLTTLRESETSLGIRILAIGGALMLAPISEEFFFRGILQTGVKKLAFVRRGSWQHRWFAIVLTAAIFGAMHLSTPHHVPALVALAVILGYLYERTGSLGGPILLHMLFNGKTLLWVAIKS